MPRQLKNWIKAYLDYTEVSEAPERFHLWTAISTIAGALRRKVWIDMGDFEWSPNLFVFFVAPPAVIHKSTTADVGIKLLREIDGIHLGPTTVTWQALIESFQEAQVDWKPNGIMSEGIPMSCLTISASELGVFFDPDNREFIDLLVDIYDGRRAAFERRTKKEGQQIVTNPWLNLIACTTPAWISQYVSQHFTGGGFASRTIFVYGEVPKRLIPYPFVEARDRSPLRRQLVADLKEIASLSGRFRLDKSAIEWGSEWYIRHKKDPPKALANDTFSSYLGRKQAHLHKIAMAMAVSQSSDLVLTAADLQAAEHALTDLEPDMPRAFRMMQREDIAGLAGSLLIVLQQGGKMQQRDLFLEFWREVSYETFNGALTSLIETGLVVREASTAGAIYLAVNDALLAKHRPNGLGNGAGSSKEPGASSDD